MTDKPDVAGDNGPDPEATPDTAEAANGEAVAGEVTENGADSELMELRDALATAETELVNHREAMLRMQAEMENLRKRLIKDLERSRARALEAIMNDLLPVRDSLERGMEIDESAATVQSMKEGKALIIRMLGKVMSDHGLHVIDPAGEPFDPEFHQAMTVQPSEECEPNTVLEVLQKGFRLHDRLIRPAMVVVSKAPDES